MNKIVLRDLQENIILQYESNVIPHIEECIALSHHGVYVVFNVVHYITDDRDENELEELLWIDVYVRKLQSDYNKECKQKR